MYREIGLLLVLLLPVAVFFLSRPDNPQQTTPSKTKKSKKKNKKKANSGLNKTDSNKVSSSTTAYPASNATKDVTTEEATSIPANNVSSPLDGQDIKDSITPNTIHSPPPETKTTVNNIKDKEIDEHMDMTSRYSRVMRIRTETPDEPLPAVPYEDGWNQVKTAKFQQGTKPKDEPLTKKQRENLARAAKKKELKAQADALQEQRLRQHQRQLEKERMAAFYSTGAGKHTPWGSKPRKTQDLPDSSSDNHADEIDQLIWD